MLLLFFHTLVKHGHIAPDYRLQNHIHTCLSHRDASTQMQRGSGGGVRLYENHPLLILGLHPKADPLPLVPKLVQFSIFSFFLYFFLAKVNLSNHRNQTCVPLEEFLRRDAHTDVTTCFFHDLLFDRPVLLCGDPLPELASDIPPAHPKKRHLGKWRPWLTSAWCLTSPSWAWIKCLYMFVYRCVCIMSRCRCKNRRPTYLVYVWECNAYRARKREEVAGGTFPQARVALIYRQWK